MKTRLFIFIVATLFSLLGIMVPVIGLIELLKGPSSIAQWGMSFWFISTWILYFIIGYHWIKYNTVPKRYKRLGWFFATFSILSLMPRFYALVFVVSSIVLMLYISITVPSKPPYTPAPKLLR